jgi:glycosyltransferase involved in cell wall biosynthesis
MGYRHFQPNFGSKKSTMPIKILVISNYRSFHTVRPEAEIFIGLAKLGFDIHIMTYADADYWPYFEQVGIKMIPFHPEKKFDKKEISFIRDYLLKEKPAVLHLFNGPSTINGIQAAKGLPVKVALYRGYTGNIYWWDPTAYLKYLHPRVDITVCNSLGVEELIQRNCILVKKQTVTINKGHRIEWYASTEAADLRKTFSLPEDSLVLVTVANNRRMKGVPYLLKAMQLLPADTPVYLLLIGKDMDTPGNKKILAKGPNGHKVFFTGFQKDPLALVKAADAFVLPSITGESITKSVIEAMALGTAPLITDIPGNRELVVDGENGLVVPAKDPKALSEAILKLYQQRKLCQVYGQKSVERIANVLHTDQTILQYQKLYTQLATGDMQTRL